MLKTSNSALPATNQISEDAQKHQLFNHYLEHSYKDIPNSKSNSSNKVIEGIIKKFNNKYQPEKYFINKESSNKPVSNNTINDSLEEIRSVAHLAVWEAAHKYVWGTSKKINGELVSIDYKGKFLFCQFASQHVKFKLQTFLRRKNLDRVCGHVPETDDIKKIYTILPKIKFKKGSIQKKDYENIAKITRNLNGEDVHNLNKLVTSKVISGDEEKNDDEGNTTNNWDYLTSIENKNGNLINNELVVNDTEEIVQNNTNIKNFYFLVNFFLNELPSRDCEILQNTKFKDFSNLNKVKTQIELGKKFNISAEAIRKISEKRFNQFEFFIKKNKKKLGR